MTHNPATNRVPIIQDGVLGHDVHSLKSHSGSSLPLPDFPKLSLYVPPLCRNLVLPSIHRSDPFLVVLPHVLLCSPIPLPFG